MFQITSKEFVDYSPGTYPLPEGVTLFIVVRNGTERYIYHTSFELRLNDEVYAMASPENIQKMELLLNPPAKS